MIKKVSGIYYSKSVRFLLSLLLANINQVINTMTLPQFLTIFFPLNSDYHGNMTGK